MNDYLQWALYLIAIVGIIIEAIRWWADCTKAECTDNDDKED